MKNYTIEDLNQLSHAAAKKLAKKLNIPRASHGKSSEIISPPTCSSEGCIDPKTVMDWHWTSGKPIFRNFCITCHNNNTAKRYALTHPSASWVTSIAHVIAHKNGCSGIYEYANLLAKKQGFASMTHKLNTKHPYRQYRKDYCENIDGRLGNGKSCSTNVFWDGMLDVDHIDENPANNNLDNLQTLCKCCHAFKTNEFVKKYGQTPGRKTLGIKRS